MTGERQHTKSLETQPIAGNGAVCCVALLAICLALDGYNGFIYLGSFREGIFDFARRPIGRDFVNYWTAGVAVFDGMVPQIFDIGPFHAYQERLFGQSFALHNWSYPPHMLLLVWPLGLLPYLWALAAWSIVTFVLYFWAASMGRQDRTLLLLALLVAPVTYQNLAAGQNGFLTGALLIAGLRLLGPRPVVAGILFGILTVKPQLGILLPFALLAARQWTAIASATLTTAVLMAVSVVLFGWQSWQAYADLVIPLQTQIMSNGEGFFQFMMPSVYMGLRLLDAGPPWPSAIQIVFAVIAVAGVLWTFARSDDRDLRLGVLAVGTVLAAPYGFNYDMTTVTLAVAVIGLRGLRGGFLPGELMVLMLTWMLPTAVLWLNAARVPLAPPILLVCFFYFLLRVAGSLRHEERRGFSWAKSSQILTS